jgi:hypothetical protein
MIRKLVLGAVVAVMIGLGAQPASAAPTVVVEPGTVKVIRGHYYEPRFHYVYPAPRVLKAYRPERYVPRHWRR